MILGFIGGKPAISRAQAKGALFFFQIFSSIGIFSVGSYTLDLKSLFFLFFTGGRPPGPPLVQAGINLAHVTICARYKKIRVFWGPDLRHQFPASAAILPRVMALIAVTDHEPFSLKFS
jgi:hypothetical protein